MRRIAPAFVFLLLVSSVKAQPPARSHDVTPDDYASIAMATELAVSPDGKQVAYCLATWDVKADNRRTDLWVVDTDGKGKPRQLTKDRANDRHPKWSADGKSIFVLGNRKRGKTADTPTHVWKVSVEDGEVKQMTPRAHAVSGFDYAPKGDAIFYSADVETTDEGDFSNLRDKFKSLEYGHGKRKVSVLHRVRGVGTTEKLIEDNRYIREFAITQDGKRIAMITAFDDTVLKSEGESRVDVWEDGKITTPPTDVYRKKAASPWAWLESLAWNPDGTKFAFCAVFDGYPAEIVIGEMIEEKWIMKTMPPRQQTPLSGNIRGYGTIIKWVNSETISFMRDSLGRVLIDSFDTSGMKQFGLPGTYFTSYFDSGPPLASGSPSIISASSLLPAYEHRAFPTIRRHNPNSPIVLVAINSHTNQWKLPRIIHIAWEAPDKTPVGGVLELPPGYKKGQKLPLVVAIHGGPTTASYADLEFDPHNGRLYFSAAGYAVLCPNYRGSTGYGDKFVTDLLGRENDIEVKDILTGIQHLIDEGIADPERIGVMGWSNGGYLTNCLISMKDCPIKFKAASSGAGIVDTVAEWGFNDEPAYPRVLKKGLPWEVPENYRKTSPTYQLGNVKTPTLIHVGGGDERCPPGHSRMLYRALKEYVNVPTQLVVYPGEPHGLTKLSNRKAKMEWDLAWFEKYLK
jgi:dipeptidyl aminopeptidase/acylaminoacyl peptidase